jgi:gliding motility-associated-like protein
MVRITKSITYIIILFCFSNVAADGFFENKGQFDKSIISKLDLSTHSISMLNNGFSVLLHDHNKWAKMVTHYHDDLMHNHSSREINATDTLRFQLLKYSFIGANFSTPNFSQPSEAYYNFYLGNDTSKWVGGVRKYSKLIYKSIYPNIDLEYEVIGDRFKYNFILNPGANLNDIRVNIEGHNGLSVQPNRITLKTNFGDFSEVMPLSFEMNGSQVKVIQMKYVDHGDYIGFESSFLKSKVKTVIDPELIFSTYSGSTVDNFGFTASYDDDGNLYSGGIATSPTKFLNGVYPTTPGAFDITFNGGEPNTFACDIAISKYSNNGQNLIYATYLGGRANDYPHSLIVDQDNQLIVFGTSSSSDYPTTANSADPFYNGSEDIIVTKFSVDGTALVGSTFIGGSGSDGINDNGDTRYFYADDYRGEVNLDNDGNIFIATSSSSFNFPTTAGVIQPGPSGVQDGVVISLSHDLSSVRWSTYFGGSLGDAIYSVDISSDGDLYIAGGTSSRNIPTTNGVYSQNRLGETDGFIARLTSDGTQVKQATYYGSPGYDQILQLEIGKFGNIYVVGHSENNIPTRGVVYSNNNGKQFVSKFKPDLSELLISSVYGSGGNVPDITINAFLVDDCNKIYVSGWGSNSEDIPGKTLSGMPLSDDAFQKTTDGQDFHLVVFEEDMADLSFATYFGGNQTGDHVDGGTSRFDKRGIVYQSVCSSCPENPLSSRISDFPTTPGAYSENNPSPRCSNASFKMAVVPFNLPPNLPPKTYVTNVVDTLNIQVGDTFSFDYPITDPEGDSLYVYFDIPSSLNSSLISFEDTLIGKGNLTAKFSLLFSCTQAGRSFKIDVHAEDRGCPNYTDSMTSILIQVDTTQVLPPPDVLCLNFVSDDELRIDWESTPLSDYFLGMALYRVDPNGDTSLLTYSKSQLGGSYSDFDVIDPRNRDYTYFLIVENICNEWGKKSYLLSSTRESQVPVEETYLKTATVSGSSIEVVFLKSKEDDFGYYEIYKGTRDKGNFKYLTSIVNINDTIYEDADVDVNTTSYCYQVRVVDDCGHLSSFSNKGCTIVIRGEALNDKKETPRFKFDLSWDNYINWNGGVMDYELLRSVDTGSLRPIVRLNEPLVEYRDSDLDFDWGGYWYSILAYEGPGSQDATSRSNDIYLIQPPLVFVPNAITANGDNLNDAFGWSDVFVREFEIKIFNRWGEKVFQSSNKNDTWTGVYKQTDLAFSNVYFWIVRYRGWDNNVYNDKGTLTIVK